MSKFTTSIILLIILLSFKISHSQTVAETKSWIANKIPTLEYSNQDIRYDYTITFTDKTLNISENIKTYFQGQESIINTTTNVPISQIGYLTFDEKSNTVWLTVKAKDNLKVFSKELDGKESLTNECIMIFSKLILKDDLQNRLRKAFNNLIIKSGGKVIKETF
ncbi:hypothetical protein EZ449_21485 [Pedobacter frigidisoli]|uniref:DUF4468 domain-containing protein n=1 Tax=Pedobacter frigidisoli TaxID=2530455 RepID=A0A4R0NF68_9SPHI|nr:hypothetical protein [Pedobacter frigidisoli]TCC99101.1 hypothetical protein EZ449_21485 [Pedobacter frigidisoli]